MGERRDKKVNLDSRFLLLVEAGGAADTPVVGVAAEASLLHEDTITEPIHAGAVCGGEREEKKQEKRTEYNI